MSDDSISSSPSSETPHRKSEPEPSLRKRAHLRRKTLRSRIVSDYIEDAAEESSDSSGDSSAGSFRPELVELYRRRGEWRENFDPDAEARRFEALAARQQSLEEPGVAPLPTLKDPRLFRAGCARGTEREACVRVLRKLVEQSGTKQVPAVFSISALPKFPGFVFVEAASAAQVREALEGLIGVMSDKMVQVPVEEIAQVFEPDPTLDRKIPPLSFARIIGGLYDGDLCLVQEEEDDGAIKVKVVPRLKEASLALKNELTRPPPRLFRPSEHPTATLKKGRYVLGRQTFEGGMLLHRVKPRGLKLDIDPPTLTDFRRFAASEDATNQQKMARILAASAGPGRLERGARVVVVAGDMIGARGEVVDAEAGAVRVDIGTGPPVAFPRAQLARRFDAGEAVEVVAGPNRGAVGVFLHQDDTAAWMLEPRRGELKVRPQDLALSFDRANSVKGGDRTDWEKIDVTRGTDRISSWRRGDLARLSSGGVGYVLCAGAESITLLLSDGERRSLRPSELGDRLQSFAARTSHGDEIGPGATVAVRRGPRSGVRAAVRRIFGSTAWLESPEGEIFVEDPENCRLLGETQRDPRIMMARFNRPGDPEELAKPVGVSLVQLVGRRFKILKGEWKGFEGILRKIFRDQAEVELTARMKVITLPLTSISIDPKLLQAAGCKSCPPNRAERDFTDSNFELRAINQF